MSLLNEATFHYTIKDGKMVIDQENALKKLISASPNTRGTITFNDIDKFPIPQGSLNLYRWWVSITSTESGYSRNEIDLMWRTNHLPTKRIARLTGVTEIPSGIKDVKNMKEFRKFMVECYQSMIRDFGVKGEIPCPKHIVDI